MVSLGCDYSTKCVGVAIIEQTKTAKILMLATRLPLDKFKENRDRRHYISSVVKCIAADYSIDMLVMERIRLFRGSAISLPTIIALTSMFTSVMDSVKIPTYTIDTRAWKSTILKNHKASKQDAVDYVNAEYSLSLKPTEHDLADAICIAEAPFHDRLLRQMKIIT